MAEEKTNNGDKPIRNSQGQDVPEPGKTSPRAVYIKDCPFMMDKDNVDFFTRMQASRDKHTVSSVDEYVKKSQPDGKF